MLVEAAVATGHGISAGWTWLFGGAHGPAIEAAVAVIATAVGGDLIAQSAEITRENMKDDEDETKLDQGFDCVRVLRCVVLGGIYGPIEYWYFAVLAKNWVWWKQVAFDNFVFTPTVYACAIVLNATMRDGKFKATSGGEGGLVEFCGKWWDMFRVGLPLWVVADTVMFTAVPLRHRVLFSRIVGFFFQIYCMHILNDPHADPSHKFAPPKALGEEEECAEEETEKEKGKEKE
eukprot:TRINITY_DN35604_c0_g1_i1.p1 TRINITY_DN35604_c0_g1~~TRINITY_DN35604_c0_g1_i1.p1  ORF type:complete len:273 (+),score=71.93 TRINITY_DN35604_c0_g1_i1:122-820(+)